MTGTDVKQARLNKVMTQERAAARLGVSQAFLSMVERNRRSVSAKLARRVLRVLDLGPVALPLPSNLDNARAGDEELMRELGSLGYPGFAYLGARAKRNPAELLLTALNQPELDSRVAEGLPWLALTFLDMDWGWLVKNAKLADRQNRLGFTVTLARELAQRQRQDERARKLADYDARLSQSKLAREDTFCHESLTDAEKRWLRENRPPEAQRWNLLTDLAVDHLAHARA